MEDGRFGSSARRKKLDRGLTVGVSPYRPRPTRAAALMTAQSLTIGAHRNAVASMAPCLCVGPLPLIGCLHGLGGGAVGATDNSRSCPSCPLNRIIPVAVWPG